MSEKNDLSHHIRAEYCRTRPKYRQSKILTAVKVYSVVDESKHLMVFGVPKINLFSEIKQKLIRFGPITRMECMTDTMSRNLNLEQFTDCFHVIYEKLENARKAKKFLDARNFYGGILHITYACEMETVDDIREKLTKRMSEVKFRLRINQNKKDLDSAHKRTFDGGEVMNECVGKKQRKL